MSWWKSISRKRPADAQMNSELRFHIDELTDANIAEGMSPEEARRRAFLEFGGSEQIKEDLRDVYRVRFVEATLANLKVAFRFIRKSPSFSLTVILTLALGIGANSAVFSAINAILLRPLPFPDGDQLVRLDQYRPKVSSPRMFVAPVRLEDWNRLNSTFQAITGYYTENSSETSGALPERLSRAWVAPRFFQVWGIAPALGRGFNAQEETFGGPAAVIISDRLWRRRFGADPNAVGKTLRVDGFAYPVIGVLPPSFSFLQRDVDLWSPIPPNSPIAQSRESTWYTTIGRLKSGVTLAQAASNLATVQGQLGKAFPKTDADLAVEVRPLKETIVRRSRTSLWLLFGSVSLLLLIACTNIIVLLLARAAQRQQEVSVRFSLGAPRGVIVMQLLAETFVLALTGAVLGLAVAGAASGVFRSLAENLPRVEEIRLDARIVLYTLVCSVAATLLCGLVPALRGTRRNLSASLSYVSRTQVSSRTPLQWLLVGVQVALAVTLLAGAGLLVRSLQALGRVSPGFEVSRILTFHVSASWAETADMKGLTQRVDRILDSLRTLPGVEDAATAGWLPGVADPFQMEIKLSEGQQDSHRKIIAEARWVAPAYFATLRIPLLEGGACREAPGSLQAVVNRSFADTYLAGSTIIGHHVELVGNTFPLPPAEILGVVGDAREQGLNRAPGPTVYWCSSAPIPGPFYLVRTHGDPMTMAETIRQQIHQIEPARSVFDVIPLQERLGQAFAENRLRTVLLAFFAATAVSLVCVGLYGTLSYSVNLRRREVGLRLALGAVRSQIVRRFLFTGLTVAALGCLVGWALALASSRALAGMLYGVSPTDTLTLSTVVVLMLLVAAAASLLPALRAARVEPVQVLRDE
jgi:putative ABC transport system permease protein